MGWTHSILNWYETREVKIELPESLQIETKTQILETPETEKEESHETVQY
jgi:hypothetical protein